MALAPRVVLVHRRSELEELTQRHSTRGQVEFFLKQRGRTLEDVDLAHAEGRAAINEVGVSIPLEWRRAEVERASLPQFLGGELELAHGFIGGEEVEPPAVDGGDGLLHRHGWLPSREAREGCSSMAALRVGRGDCRR